MFEPTEHDRERLELLHEQLAELKKGCSCGPDDACDECGGEPGITEDFYVCMHNADTLQLELRLEDVDAKSKLARRANLDPDFAEVALEVSNAFDSAEDMARAVEAIGLISDMRYSTKNLSAAKALLEEVSEGILEK